jgi:ABC-type nitrate/sulfonate/bicarbonate transport system substrate-binding protein
LKCSFVLVAGALLWLGAVLRAPSYGKGPVVFRVLCLPGCPLALIVAQEQLLFAKYGIEVRADVAPTSDALRGALAQGTYELAHAAVDNAVALAEQSGTDVVVLLGGEGSTNELIAQPSVSSIADLRNQTLIVDAPTTAYAIQLKKILLLNGLRAGSDYRLKAIGGTPLRLTALREHKEYAASILGPPTSLIAKHEGFVSLGPTSKWLGPYQGIGGFARHAWAQANRKELIQYISAFIEGQRWLLDPARKAEVLWLLSREYKLSEAFAKEAYDAWIVAPGGQQPDARLDVVGLQSVLKLREEIERSNRGAPLQLEKYYDPSFYDAALANLKAEN